MVTLPYRLFAPARATSTGSGERHPLVLFLHGAGERGTDNVKQITANEGATVWASEEVQSKHPCFVLAPQCPETGYWGSSPRKTRDSRELRANSILATVCVVLDEVVENYPVDTSRLYVTGLSMGGFGAMALLSLRPHTFAAAVIVCGGGNPRKVENTKHVPTWFFHAEDDDVVPVTYSRTMYYELKKIGAPVRYTEYPSGYLGTMGLSPHASWVPAYRDKEMIEWLFEQRLTRT